MLSVDEGDNAAHRLRFSENLKGERGFTRGFRTVDLDDTSARHSTDTKSGIEGERSRRDGFNLQLRSAIAEFHDRAGSKLLFDFLSGRLDHLIALGAGSALVNLTGRACALCHLDS